MIVHPRNYSVSQTHIVAVPVIALLQNVGLTFTTADVLHAREKQLPYCIPVSRHGYNVGCIEWCSMFIELADYETVG